jgi:hypothetical protein
LILEQLANGVWLLKVNRPEALNALNSTVLNEMGEALRQIGEMDYEDARALIITGAGEKAFVAGADIKEISELDEERAAVFAQRGQSIFHELTLLKIPVIAAVNGFALGGGFAPQKMNVKIFERFRAACDDFFGRKAEYFKALKVTFSENIEKKKALVEKAQALADSTDWKATSDKLIALQKEWKTVGMVPKKLGDQLWQEFLGACNKFFEARNAAGAGQRNEEHANLEKKKGIIEQLKALAENAAEATKEKVQALTEEYNKVGHVPYKEKDKLYEAYHEVLDRIYKELNISTKRRRLNDFKANIKNVAKRGEEALDNERGRLARRFEQLKQEIQTYENNLGFLNASSKKGNSLIDEMNRKVQHLRDDLELVRQKIKAIDEENK